MSWCYPIPGPRAFGPFGPCPPPWIYGPPCAPCPPPCPQPCEPCTEPCKLIPSSVALDNRVTTIVTTTSDVVVDWNTLLSYDTIIVRLNGNLNDTSVAVDYNLYIGGPSSGEADFIKSYKEQNCVCELGMNYLASQIVLKMTGNVKVTVYQYSTVNKGVIYNDFYRACLPPSTNPNLTYTSWIFVAINDGPFPTTALVL